MRTMLAMLMLPTFVFGGLHYSGDAAGELPSQWRGFLLDHRALRMAASTATPSLLRDQYDDATAKLEAKKTLTADEVADLGALHVLRGKPAKGVEVLRQGHRDHPTHFRIVANLGTAWQLAGDLAEAERSLQVAVGLAPPRWKPFEEAHLKLVSLRLREPRNPSTYDELFGRIDKGKLPANDVAIAQQLALWLPADARLLWLLAELAHAHGDDRTAASIMEGVVTEFALTSKEARDRRQTFKSAADAVAKLPDSEHAKYRGDVAFRSVRPIGRTLDLSRLPAVRADGVNQLPWPVLAETSVSQPFKPKFHEHLKALDGKRVSLTGYMQPVTQDIEVSGFLLMEFAVGCWFCETPEPAGLLYIEIAGGKAVPVKRSRVKVEGVLKLNATDAEDFLYTIKEASVREPD